jgi:hypothetical protein
MGSQLPLPSLHPSNQKVGQAVLLGISFKLYILCMIPTLSGMNLAVIWRSELDKRDPISET